MTTGQKVLIGVTLLALLCIVTAGGVGAWYLFLRPKPNPPVVTIEAPRHNEQVEAGTMVSVQANVIGFIRLPHTPSTFSPDRGRPLSNSLMSNCS